MLTYAQVAESVAVTSLHYIKDSALLIVISAGSGTMVKPKMAGDKLSQFVCFTSTKVQMLTLSRKWQATNSLSLFALLVQKYKC
jgi:hypothetical protein